MHRTWNVWDKQSGASIKGFNFKPHEADSRPCWCVREQVKRSLPSAHRHFWKLWEKKRQEIQVQLSLHRITKHRYDIGWDLIWRKILFLKKKCNKEQRELLVFTLSGIFLLYLRYIMAPKHDFKLALLTWLEHSLQNSPHNHEYEADGAGLTRPPQRSCENPPCDFGRPADSSGRLKILRVPQKRPSLNCNPRIHITAVPTPAAAQQQDAI